MPASDPRDGALAASGNIRRNSARNFAHDSGFRVRNVTAGDMAKTTQWAFPDSLRPTAAEARFDLDAAFDAMVLMRAEVPERAFTAGILGTERAGNGVVIREDGLILTIGYLVTEAEAIWLTTNRGDVLAGHPLAYDQSTGFGLVQPLGDWKRLGLPVMPRGSAMGSAVGDPVFVLGHGGTAHSLKAKLVARREFAGSWEYLLDEALFTTPAHPQWGGTALLDTGGRLIGLGSLLVQDKESLGGQAEQGNMFVPIDLLDPVIDDMLATGRAGGAPRPWIGMYSAEVDGHVGVTGTADGGPAARAGVRAGDLVIDVGGERVTRLADLYRKVWRLGAAGVEVPLTLGRKGEIVRVKVRSLDRNDLLAKPQMH